MSESKGNIWKHVKRVANIFIGLIIIAIFAIAIAFYKKDIPAATIEEKYRLEGSEFIALSDGKMHIRKVGKGPVLFLVHGSFSSLHTWEEWQEHLKDDFTTISFDLPGHGLTGPGISGKYTADHYAALIIELAEALDIEKFHIAGNSLGGQVAIRTAILAPKKIQKLILLNSAGAGYATSHSDVADSKRKGFTVFDLLKYDFTASMLKKLTPRFLVDKSLRQVYHIDSLITPERSQRYYELLLREGNRAATIERFRQENTPIIWEDFDPPPTLIMWGRHDTWIPVRQAWYFRRMIPDTQLIIYENSGHVPMEEIPETTAQDALTFLKAKSIHPDQEVLITDF